MSAKKLKVVVTRKLPAPVELRLKELFDARLNNDDHPFTQEELVEAMQTADVLVPTVTDKLDGRIMARAGDQLRLIAQFGAGVDNIDVQSAVQRGITVTNTPGVLTDDTADVAMALILSVPRRLFEGAQIMNTGGFDGWTPTWMMGRRLAGKRLGIIGMGRIGQAVAPRPKAFGLQIHYHNRKPVSPRIEELLEATYWDSLDQMLARMDIVSVNCPHTPATFHLMNARRIELMKPESYIVNTARGEVIDEAALARAREFAPFDVSAWALTGLLWRVTDPEKAAWLHEQEGLVQLLPLADSEEVMPPAIALLGRLHDTSAFPLGQSLRGGTQTRGILFDRTEPALADLKRAILSTVGTYRESLPERDASHPLLRHCSGEWRLNGSWSVRLRSGGDHHAPHIHPQGILSSALYLMLPPPDEDGSQGTLELGRPAPDLRLDLPPLHRIAPKEGHLALFPSTLYHGTTAFGSGMRMTTAFDVIARGGLGDGTDDDGSRLE